MHILAVRVGRVGDTVMMTPALRAILQCYPDAELTILASPEGKTLLRDFDNRVKQIWTWDRHGFFKNRSDRKQLQKLIASNTFEHIFCFDTSQRIAGLFANTSARLHWFSGTTEIKHTARHYLDLVAASCNVDVGQLYNYLPIDPLQSRRIDEELATHGITPNDIVVMMHPTYSGYTQSALRKRSARIRKLWPATSYAELGKRLAAERIAGKAVKPLIDLLPGELPLGKEIVALSDNCITLLESRPPFGRYKALIHRADLILTPDSGPMHIASALGTPVVAFFSMKDPADCGPYMPPSLFTILRSDDPVRGISTIDVASVHSAVRAQIETAIKHSQINAHTA